MTFKSLGGIIINMMIFKGVQSISVKLWRVGNYGIHNCSFGRDALQPTLCHCMSCGWLKVTQIRGG